MKGSDLLENIARVMKLKEDVVLGFMELVIGFKSNKDVSLFVSFAATLNKVNNIHKIKSNNNI